MRITGPKTRLARRIGEALREKDVKYLVKRNYPPGMHGQNRVRKSEYGLALAEKQKARWTYDIGERQFRRYVESSVKHPGMTHDILLQFLELRLDNAVYRLGFAASRAQARQLVTHGFFTVNGKKVDIPSYELKPGDEIAVSESKRATSYIEHLMPGLKEFKPQEWLSLDPKELKGKVLGKPTAELVGSTIQMDLIVEHYSR
ncbi:MAG: 30S ribosomal protein S4 [Candidatus Doudnabacteria bacterium]|nr:30S ribosomal protein S4 [Candidatus Doudnabacteria bacterium]